MNTFVISLRALRAAFTHVDAKEIRESIRGVCVDLGAGRIIGTDGSRMFICEGPKQEHGPRITLPAELVKRVLKVKSGRHDYGLNVTVSESGAVSIVAPTGDSFSGQCVGVAFPDWQRVVPLEYSGAPGQFNLRFLADAADALAIFHGTKPNGYARILHNGTGGAVIHNGKPGAFVVLMPARGEVEMPEELATFVGIRQETEQGKAAA